MGGVKRIEAIATQGRNDHAQWVTSYKFAYSVDDVTYDYVMNADDDGTSERDISGNSDSDTSERDISENSDSDTSERDISGNSDSDTSERDISGNSDGDSSERDISENSDGDTSERDISGNSDGDSDTSEREFSGNSDGNTVVVNDVSPPIVARYVRLYPQTYHVRIALRWEVYGCA